MIYQEREFESERTRMRWCVFTYKCIFTSMFTSISTWAIDVDSNSLALIHELIL